MPEINEIGRTKNGHKQVWIACVNCGKKHFYQVWRYYPEYYEKAERTISHTVFRDKSLEQLRHEWEAQIPMFTDEEDLRPCMCAL